MKKKIKDLTLEEKNTICCKHYGKCCIGCPLGISLSYYNKPICIKDMLESEVEVDE